MTRLASFKGNTHRVRKAITDPDHPEYLHANDFAYYTLTRSLCYVSLSRSIDSL